MLASYVLAEERTQILAKLAYQRCNYCKCLISRKCSHIKRYDSSLAKSIKCCFKRKVDWHMISPYEKRGSAFERLSLQAQGLELLWVEASTPCRGHTGTSTLSEESRETGLVASCLRFYSPQPTCRQHSQLIGVKLSKIFSQFSKALRSCGHAVKEKCSKSDWVFPCLKLSQAQDGSGVKWAHESQIGNELCIAYLEA